MTRYITHMRTLVRAGYEAHRGGPDYLTAEMRENFSRDLIAQMEDPSHRLTRSDAMYLQYYKQPYLKTFSEAQFLSRWADVWDNLLVITPELKIGAPDMTKSTRWMECFCDLLSESQFRGGISTDASESKMLQSFRDRTQSEMKHIPTDMWEKDYVFKFGKQKWINQSFDDEKIRFMRSGRYSATDMNRAQQDDENEFLFSVMPMFLKELDGITGFSAFDQINLDDGLIVRIRNSKEFLVWCASNKYNPAIPYAFDYDTVLVVKDRKRFRKSIGKQIRKINPQWRSREGRVSYKDPYLQLDVAIDPSFTKHFRFSYQNEYRIVVNSDEVPEELFLDVPNLREYSEVYSLH